MKREYNIQEATKKINTHSEPSGEEKERQKTENPCLHKGKDVFSPEYEEFADTLKRDNSGKTDEELAFPMLKKKRKLYYNFKKLRDAEIKNLPPGECVGATTLEKRKIFGQEIKGYMAYKGKFLPIYNSLPMNIIGFVPVKKNDEDATGKYVLVTKRNTTAYNLIFAITFIYVLLAMLVQ